MAERTRRRHSASDALLGRLERRYGCVRLGLAAMPFSAVLAAAVALAASYPSAVILVGGWAAVYMLVVTAAVTYRQQLTPEHLLSRVNTTGRMLSWGLGSTGGAAVTGVLASLLGVRSACCAPASFLLRESWGPPSPPPEAAPIPA